MSDASRRTILPPIEKYLGARKAAERLGKFLFPDDWIDTDIEALSDDQDDSENLACERARYVKDQLFELLKHRSVGGYFDNGEAAIRPLESVIQEPWFEIDILRSSVRIWHDRWTQLYFDGPELLAAIDTAKPLKPRKAITYRWENIVFEVWRYVVEYQGRCTQVDIVNHTKSWHSENYKGEPDYKEPNTLAKRVLTAYQDQTSGKL